jgi:hypothetical protein
MKRTLGMFALCLILIVLDSTVAFAQVGADKRPVPLEADLF